MTSPGTRTHPRLIEIAIEPKSKAGREKLSAALATLVTDDSGLGVSTDPDSGQIILNGMSEQHLDGAISALRHTYGIDINVGAPQVAYRETVTHAATVEYTHKKHAGPKSDFAKIRIEARPTPRGTPFAFHNSASKTAVPDEYIPGIERGLTSVLSSGVLAGFPVVDLTVTLVDGVHHEVDSSPRAFEIAARMALREALAKAGSVLLEPVMAVEVEAPSDCAAALLRDLYARGGQIKEQDVRGDALVVRAAVPLANIFGYADRLRALSRGRAISTMRFDHYAPASLPHDGPPFAPAVGMRA